MNTNKKWPVCEVTDASAEQIAERNRVEKLPMKDRILHWHKEGQTVQQIAKRLKKSSVYVSDVCKGVEVNAA